MAPATGESDRCATYTRLKELSSRPEPRAAFAPHFGLVVPPSPFVVPNGWEFVHSAPFEGPSVVAALIKSMGCPVTLLDQRKDPEPQSLSGGTLASLDVLGVATYSDSFPYVKAVVETAKRERRDRPVVLGGPAVTSVPHVYMENTAADFAVLGEGELTLIELLDHLMGRRGSRLPKDIAGLAWRNGDGKVVINPRRTQMVDLDPVPFQDFSVWPHVQKSDTAPEIYMQYSRGCPLSCTFCFRPMPRLAYKSPGRVRAELEYLQRYGFRFIWWNDLTFIVDKRRVYALLESMNGLDFRWSAFTRVVGVHEAILSRMRQAGCDIVMYGFESITKDILEAFGKNARPHHVGEAIEVTRRAGLKVGGLFIIGAPGETEESLENLVRFCEKFKEVTRVKYLSLLPGTPEYRRALERGIIGSELEHLYFLSRERSVEDDEIINVCGLPDELLRSAYRSVNQCIQRRPYEYWNPVNRYVGEPVQFRSRPVPGGSTPGTVP